MSPFFKIDSLTAIVKRKFYPNFQSYSAKELQDALNSVGLTLLVLLVVPRYTEGWDLTTDLQLVVPLMAGWVCSDVTDYLAVTLVLKRK